MDHVQQKIDISYLLALAYRYLSYRARTEKELREYLQKKAKKHQFSLDVINKVFLRLQEEGYVNDEEFIELFVASRSHHKPKGKYALLSELQQKGISRERIENYFAQNPLEEIGLANAALFKVWYKIKTLPKLKRTQKAISFLRSRGFQYDAIKKTIEELERSE